MNSLIIILLFAALSVQTAPISLGLNAAKPGVGHLAIRMTLIVLSQLLMLLFGIWLGNRFMYLLDSFGRGVLFAGFFLIAIRFILETFKIRKGERTYAITKDADMIIPSIALSINTFLVGILLYLVPVSPNEALLYLFIFSFVLSMLFAFQSFKRRSYALVSLLYLVSGVVLIGISFFFAFF